MRDIKVIWKLPVPSTSLLDSPQLHVLPKRCYALRLRSEGDEKDSLLTLSFENVVAYRCTHDWGCSAETIGRAYDKLVDYGSTHWLDEIASLVHQRDQKLSKKLKHLGIYFDDGPHHEFVCGDVRVAEGLTAPDGAAERR